MPLLGDLLTRNETSAPAPNFRLDLDSFLGIFIVLDRSEEVRSPPALDLMAHLRDEHDSMAEKTDSVSGAVCGHPYAEYFYLAPRNDPSLGKLACEQPTCFSIFFALFCLSVFLFPHSRSHFSRCNSSDLDIFIFINPLWHSSFLLLPPFIMATVEQVESFLLDFSAACQAFSVRFTLD